MSRLLAERKVPMHYGTEELAEDISSMAVVVSDSSPLICLAAIRHFNLLRLLYSHVLIPEAVWQEITRAPTFAVAASLRVAADARDAGWLQVASAANRPLVAQLETVLDLGEAEAIALAVECAPSLLRIDERDGRQVARTLGVPLTGALGGLTNTELLSRLPARLVSSPYRKTADFLRLTAGESSRSRAVVGQK